jgi:hypothetical protein
MRKKEDRKEGRCERRKMRKKDKREEGRVGKEGR